MLLTIYRYSYIDFMNKQFLQTDFSPTDFSFVYDLNQEELELFFNVTDIAIETMLDVLSESSEEFLKSLNPDQAVQIVSYYNQLLDLYSDYDLFEDCEDIASILLTIEDYFEKNQEEVGNVNEKH